MNLEKMAHHRLRSCRSLLYFAVRRQALGANMAIQHLGSGFIQGFGRSFHNHLILMTTNFVIALRWAFGVCELKPVIGVNFSKFRYSILIDKSTLFSGRLQQSRRSTWNLGSWSGSEFYSELIAGFNRKKLKS